MALKRILEDEEKVKLLRSFFGANKALHRRCLRGSVTVQNEDASAETGRFLEHQTTQLMDKQVSAQRRTQQQDFERFSDSVAAYIDEWFDFSPENVK